MKRALRNAFAGSLLLACVPGHGAEVINGVEAIVNDSIITVWEVNMLTLSAEQLLYRQFEHQPDALEAKMNEVRRDNLKQMIDQQLILQEFKKFNLPETVVDKEVDHQIDEIIRNRYYGDRMRLIKSLQADGMSFERFRQQRRENLIIGFLRQKNVSSELIISPHKVETYYLAHREEYKLQDEVKLRMIVLKQSPDADAESTLKLGGEILGKLNEGASFAEMATIYSQGSQRKDGGDWGWKEHSVLNKGLADIAFVLDPGKYSGVLSRSAGDDYWMVQYEAGIAKLGRHYVVDPKTKKEVMTEERPLGTAEAFAGLPPAVEFYLMLVEDKHPSHYKSLGEVREEIETSLKLEEQSRIEKEWTERLKKKTFVRLF